MHPNAYGYGAMGRTIVGVMTGEGSNNARPRAVSDEYTATVGQLLKVDSLKGVLANDSDPDLAQKIRIVRFDQPSSKVAKVTVNPDGSFTYNPAGFTGEDSFLYTVSDGKLEAFGRVKIKVTGTAAPATPGRVAMGPMVPRR